MSTRTPHAISNTGMTPLVPTTDVIDPKFKTQKAYIMNANTAAARMVFR